MSIPSDANPEHRAAALDSAVKHLNKLYGDTTVVHMDQPPEAVPVLSTGCPPLDVALGIGGLPRGRVVEIFGPDGAGKTTLALQVAAEAQRKGTVAFVDVDHKLDVERATAMGVRIERLLVAQPDNGEQALEIVETMVRSGAVDLVIVDSVPGLVPKAELDGNLGDAHLGLQARLMSQSLRKITAITARTGSIVLFVNAVRQKIGVTFGNFDVTTGGNALKFYSSVRIEVRGEMKVGQLIGGKLKVVKNKLAPPFRTAEVVLTAKGFKGQWRRYFSTIDGENRNEFNANDLSSAVRWAEAQVLNNPRPNTLATYWVKLRVGSVEDGPGTGHLVAVHPAEPPCTSPTSHDWREITLASPISRSVSRSVCFHCAHSWTTNNQDTNPVDGTQGLFSSKYELPDEKSRTLVSTLKPRSAE